MTGWLTVSLPISIFVKVSSTRLHRELLKTAAMTIKALLFTLAQVALCYKLGLALRAK